MFKKILFPLVALFMLAGCAKPPTTIEVSPTITLPQQDPSLMGVTVSINGADQRQVDVAQEAANLDFGLITVEGMDLSRYAYAHRSFSSQRNQPSMPSPRVAPRTNTPFSYSSDMDRPSIFGSTQ